MENVTGLSLELIIHPGETIKELLEDRSMTQEELAIRTGYSAKHVSEIISGKKNISSKFANSLEYVFGISMKFWMNLQAIYDNEILEFEKLNHIEEKEFSILEQLKEVIAFFRKNKIIELNSNKSMMILQLRKFFGLNDLSAISNLQMKQVAFRGAKNKINIYVLYALQKLCEYLTDEVSISTKFDKELLKSKYEEIKSTMFLEPNEMIIELKKIFAECGVVFEIVNHFKGAPVQGFIRKNKEKITLCMTIRKSFIDIFWFTLFHEICHLLNDDFEDKYIDYSIVESDIEKRADDYSCNVLINKEEYDLFKKSMKYDISSIKQFAKSQNVLPSIVIGRLQNDFHDYSFLAKYKEKYVWAK